METVTDMRVNKRGFEIKTCTRCGGGGHYSYCQMYGTTCFGCHGRGTVHTKRAEMANAYLRELRTVPVSDVQVGWSLWCDASPYGGPAKSGWYRIEAIKPSGCAKISKDPVTGEDIRHALIDIDTKVLSMAVSPDSKVQAVPNQDFLTATLAKALEYQAALTVAGKPRK